jgi:hypothetical protein
MYHTNFKCGKRRNDCGIIDIDTNWGMYFNVISNHVDFLSSEMESQTAHGIGENDGQRCREHHPNSL